MKGYCTLQEDLECDKDCFACPYFVLGGEQSGKKVVGRCTNDSDVPCNEDCFACPHFVLGG